MGNVYAITATPQYRSQGLAGLSETIEGFSERKRADEVHKANIEMEKLKREALEQEIRAREIDIGGAQQGQKRAQVDRSNAMLAQRAEREARLARLTPESRARIQQLDANGPELARRLSPETLDLFLKDEEAKLARQEQAAAAQQFAQGIDESLASGELGDEAEAEPGAEGQAGPLVQFADTIKKMVASGAVTPQQATVLVEKRRVEVARKREVIGQKQKGGAMIQSAIAQVANDPSLGVEEKHARLDALNRAEAGFSSGATKWEQLPNVIERAATAKTPKQAAADATKMQLAIKGQAFTQAMQLYKTLPEPKYGQPDTRPSLEELVANRERALMQTMQGGPSEAQIGQTLDAVDRSMDTRERFDPMATGRRMQGGGGQVPRGTNGTAPAKNGAAKPAAKGKAPEVDRQSVRAKAVAAAKAAQDAGKSPEEIRAAAEKVLREGGLDPAEMQETREPSDIQGM